jgi:hypothetical protein
MTLILIIGIIIYFARKKRSSEDIILEDNKIIEVNYREID